MSKSVDETITIPSEATFLPDYRSSCSICGETPTVIIKPKSPKERPILVNLCGVCTWGEAECLDPSNW